MLVLRTVIMIVPQQPKAPKKPLTMAGDVYTYAGPAALKPGSWGGQCTCPSGRVYNVGDQDDSCGSLSCFGGVSGVCNNFTGVWSYHEVKCGPAAIKFTITGTPYANGLDYMCQQQDLVLNMSIVRDMTTDPAGGPGGQGLSFSIELVHITGDADNRLNNSVFAVAPTNKTMTSYNYTIPRQYLQGPGAHSQGRIHEDYILNVTAVDYITQNALVQTSTDKIGL